MVSKHRGAERAAHSPSQPAASRPNSGRSARTIARLRQSDAGAAAVEFAIVVPLLVLLVLGIAEFGRAYNIQLSLTAAAREGVRVMAIGNDPAAAEQAARDALTFSPDDVDINPNSCAAGTNATATVEYSFEFLTGFIPGGPITLTGNGVMRCGG